MAIGLVVWFQDVPPTKAGKLAWTCDTPCKVIKALYFRNLLTEWCHTTGLQDGYKIRGTQHTTFDLSALNTIRLTFGSQTKASLKTNKHSLASEVSGLTVWKGRLGDTQF